MNEHELKLFENIVEDISNLSDKELQAAVFEETHVGFFQMAEELEMMFFQPLEQKPKYSSGSYLRECSGSSSVSVDLPYIVSGDEKWLQVA